MKGKSMRCPNLECRQVFTVTAMEAQGPVAEPPPPPPPPKQTKLVVKTKPTKPKPAAKPTAGEEEVVDAVIVDAAIVSPPKVKEVEWTEGTDVPPKGGKAPLKPELAEDDLPVRKRKKSRGPLILAGLGIVTVFLGFMAVMYILWVQSKNEEKLA